VVNHFAAVGFLTPSREAFQGQVSELALLAEQEMGPLGIRALWKDDSGARLAMFVNTDGDLECLKPSFSGTSRQVVRPVTTLADPDGCPFCALASVEVLEDGVMAYSLFVELDDIHRGQLATAEAPIELAISAFAEELTIWPDAASYEASKQAAELELAARSLIPSGMFAPGGGERPPRAEAIVTGVVIESERRTNRYSSGAFDWCVIETFAAALDVVAEPQKQPLQAGNVVQGTFWLVGRRVGSS
jgi:hypothetical protein